MRFLFCSILHLCNRWIQKRVHLFLSNRRKIIRHNSELINRVYQQEIEKNISHYIQNHFSFCVLDVQSKEERLYLESSIVSTVSGCEECRPSSSWLGLFSPKEKIKGSGLWQVNELYKEQLIESDLVRLVGLIV